MGRSKGELDNWIIPKRCNVYQTLAFLAVLDDYPAYCNFTPSNQTNTATKMRLDYGASKARTVQAQSARTAKALAQYMGFVKTEGNRVEITEIGMRFLKNHRADLINKGGTLQKPKGILITEADEWKEQMIKLQLTNPDQPKCEDISIYPFRYVLKLLLALDYVDKEELALFVFTSGKERDLSGTIKKIKAYRSKKYRYREKQISTFISTKFGNIALNQAPSSGYFMSLCEATGLVERVRKAIPNPGAQKEITAIQIKPSKITEVRRVVAMYGGMDCLKFGPDQKKAWSYYYCSNGITYPVEVTIKNQTGTDIYVQIENTTKGDTDYQKLVLKAKGKEVIYTYPGHVYAAHIYDFTDTVPSADITFSSKTSVIAVDKTMLSSKAVLSKTEVCDEIRALILKKGVTPRIQKQLDMYELLTGKPVSNIKMYRGAYLELYFGLLLNRLKGKRVIDHYEASTSVNKYHIPHAVPNKPDFVLSLDDTNVVTEITLMRPSKYKITKDMKLEIEGALRHMKEQQDHVDAPAGKKSFGIFAAGAVNTVVEDEIKKWAKTYGITNYKVITLEELLQLLEKENRTEIENFLK